MQGHQTVGIVLIAAGILDAAAALWVPNRVADANQRTIVRVALLSSGIVVVMLGGLFFAGVVGAE